MNLINDLIATLILFSSLKNIFQIINLPVLVFIFNLDDVTILWV